MRFKKLEIEDIDTARPFFDGLLSNTCDYTAGGMFMWRDYFHMEYAIDGGVFFSRLIGEDGGPGYNIPLGAADMPAAIRRIVDYVRENGEASLRFCTVPEEYLPFFDITGLTFHRTEQTEYFDYLYDAEDFVRLEGEKHASHRNHIHQFTRFASEWDYRDLNEENLPEVITFFRDYYRPGADSPSKAEENAKTLEVLTNMDAYRMRGGILLVNGVVVGFSLCEITGDTMYVHIEKADRDVPGSYPMLAWQSAKRYAAGGVKYINREEDMGDPGLRKSKLSWHPLRLLRKYILEAG